MSNAKKARENLSWLKSWYTPNKNNIFLDLNKKINILFLLNSFYRNVIIKKTFLLNTQIRK
jgi:hypothetical protein